jgi:hypothetical protein
MMAIISQAMVVMNFATFRMTITAATILLQLLVSLDLLFVS